MNDLEQTLTKELLMDYLWMALKKEYPPDSQLTINFSNPDYISVKVYAGKWYTHNIKYLCIMAFIYRRAMSKSLPKTKKLNTSKQITL